ncbi:MAG: 3-methylitaconate isomerase [Clostridiales Family XIII bacterium]|jgi:2-methylaconitate cis-trans-isomerase PrpF|nr:3-methylitaconate isomerase [Clostridiales Family XIII bacterium]
MKQSKIPVVIMRGGTSKGIFIKAEDLPEDPALRDQIVLRVFGSPDVRQIDGLGGADPLTSKLAIIGKSAVPGADVDYTFGQVSYKAPTIDYSGNCGNISSAVGPYAVDEGLVPAVEPVTTVRVYNTNTQKILVEQVQVEDGRAKVDGDYAIAGVPGTGAEVVVDFSGTAGAATGKLLPTGNVVDTIETAAFGPIGASLVDAANPVVFVRAKDLGMTGIETPAQIDENKQLLDALEEIRGKGAVLMGLTSDWEAAAREIPAFPMVAVVAPAQGYKDFTTGKDIGEGDVDFVSRLMFMQVTHKTYAGTATTCTGAAARIEGTVVQEAMAAKGRGHEPGSLIRIGHPAGVIGLNVEAEKTAGGWALVKAEVNRTARRIMEGTCYYHV